MKYIFRICLFIIVLFIGYFWFLYTSGYFYHFQWNKAFEAQQYEKAQEYYIKWIEIFEKKLFWIFNKNTASFYNNIAMTFEDQNNKKRAILFYQKSLEVFPEFTEWKLNLCRVSKEIWGIIPEICKN